MANFKLAITEVLKSEGGYVDDPDDAGGETYKGVARKMHPKWIGWHIVDLLKTQSGFPHSLDHHSELQSEILQFYKNLFWDKISGDTIRNQSIAELLVDSAVNEGVVPAIKRAQSIVHIPQTGKITPELINLLNSLS